MDGRPLHFCASLAAVAVAGAGAYTFEAFALLMANSWVHMMSTLFVLLRRKGRFVVTAKQGRSRAQPGAVLPALLAGGALLAAMGWAFAGTLTAGTINNVAFVFLHVSVLTVGAWPALWGRRVAASDKAVQRADERAEVAA